MANNPQLWQVLVLAFVQGLTEFLPISSSGHIVALAAWLGQGDGQPLEVGGLNVALHVGTLGSICVFYWRRIGQVLRRDHRLLALLVVGTLPTVVLGVVLKVFFEPLFSSPMITGVLLMVTGVVLLATGRISSGHRAELGQLTFGRACLVGVAQAVAVLPGLSRSGMTISTGLWLGLPARPAATFSFLLAIPAITGAGLWQAVSEWKSDSTTVSPGVLAAGMLVSFLVGLGALYWLVSWLEKGRFSYFAWWCIPLGAAIVIAQWIQAA